MPLARLQVSILNHLRELGRLNEEQVAEVSSTPVELSGSDMDLLLIEDYKLTEFQLLVAKSHAVGLQPYNARNFLTHARAFERVERDFCKEHGVLPVGEVGEYFIIAISDPFNLRITNTIQEMTGMNVLALLALERDIMEHLDEDKEEEQSVGFGDVVEALGMEFDFNEEGIDEEELEEESAPIIQLANRIIEEAYLSGGSSTFFVEGLAQDRACRSRTE